MGYKTTDKQTKQKTKLTDTDNSTVVTRGEEEWERLKRVKGVKYTTWWWKET